ncbi:hypothetical protein F5Y10DRAFT_292616 [Nemania abortiva]|nr:hypothetical protein F5Y10DRAFT_292616 [Nemania abortiva]
MMKISFPIIRSLGVLPLGLFAVKPLVRLQEPSSLVSEFTADVDPNSRKYDQTGKSATPTTDKPYKTEALAMALENAPANLVSSRSDAIPSAGDMDLPRSSLPHPEWWLAFLETQPTAQIKSESTPSRFDIGDSAPLAVIKAVADMATNMVQARGVAALIAAIVTIATVLALGYCYSTSCMHDPNANADSFWHLGPDGSDRAEVAMILTLKFTFAPFDEQSNITNPTVSVSATTTFTKPKCSSFPDVGSILLLLSVANILGSRSYKNVSYLIGNSNYLSQEARW